MKINRFIALSIIAFSTLWAHPCHAATSYTMHVIGAGTAYAVNDSGQVVGNYNNGYSFVWQNGNAVQLPILTGMMFSDTRCINNAGLIAGHDDMMSAHAVETHAWVWQNGVKTVLPTLGGYTSVLALNDSGQVLGYAYDSQNVRHTVIWNDSTIQDLGTLNVFDINNSGVMCGITSGQYAMTYDHGTTVSLEYIYSDGKVTAINNLGDVLGAKSSSATMWSGGASIRLPTSFIKANDINDSRQIVGYAYSSAGNRAVVWNNGTMINLGVLAGGTESQAFGINSNGWIVGYSTDSRGVKNAVLWEPVPEPASVTALLCGLAGIGIGAKRKRRANSQMEHRNNP